MPPVSPKSLTHFPNPSTFRACSCHRPSSRVLPRHHIATRPLIVVDLHPPDIQLHPHTCHHLSHCLSCSCMSVSHRLPSSLVHVQQNKFPLHSTFHSPLTTFAGSTQDSGNDINCKFPFDTDATDSHDANDCIFNTKPSTTDKSLSFIKTAMAAELCMTPVASATTAPSVAQHRQAVTILLAIATLL